MALILLALSALSVWIFLVFFETHSGGREAGAMIAAAAVGAPLVILFSRFVTELRLVLFEMNRRHGEIRDK